MSRPVRLSCIVPAYNEAPRIAAVLAVALATAEIDEVIVIDDGSTDGTAEVVEALNAKRLKLIRQTKNGGKTRAVCAGIAAARGAHVLLLDSDLVGLSPSDLSCLISPVTEGRADASVSLRRNAPLPWRWIGLDYISGERVMPRAVLADRIETLARLPRFGLEVFMNRIWIEAGLTIAVVQWPGVASPMKHEKRGALAGAIAEMGMLSDIFRTIGPLAALGQIATLRARRI